MTWRSKVWLAVAALFSLVNLAGAVYAAWVGEPLHAALHAALLLPGAYAAWRLAPERDGRRGWLQDAGATAAGLPGELTGRLTHLEQAVDAVALEVERIGEGQRFVTRVLVERDPPRARGEGGAAPAEITAHEAPPPARRS